MSEAWEWGADTMARDKNQVNLDAMIPRGDLFEVPDGMLADSPAIRITDLEPNSVTYTLLRKPDFQRETANWSPPQIASLIRTFCESDIIPAIILWQSGSQIFVVDGAHRLSALIAWVHGDFGAGPLSRDLFRGKIPPQQQAMHDQTMALVENAAGRWDDFKAANAIVSMKALEVQWIKGHTPQQAANAFIRINQGGTIIDSLEVRILKAARSALSVATRVIARGGAGHPYWRHFTDEKAKQRAPVIGAEIFNLLFDPPLEVPIKSLDVPLAGLGYGAGVIRLAFDLVGLANGLAVPDSTRKRDPGNPLPDDPSGAETLQYLRRSRKVIQLILSNEAHSFGLHPALYFYTANGAFQPASLLNTVAWMMSLEKTGRLDQFRKVRGIYEDLILAHPVIVKPAAHKLGSGARTRSKMLALFDRAIDLLNVNSDSARTWEKLRDEFPHLVADEAEEAVSPEGGAGRPFSSSAKSALTFGDLATAPRCRLCGGILHKNGKVADHIEERSGGGTSSSRNGRWIHPVCNSNRKKDLATAEAVA